MDEKFGNNLAEDDTCLRRVVGDVAGVLDKLGKVEIRERETSNFGDKLRASRVSTAKTRGSDTRKVEGRIHSHVQQNGGQQQHQRQLPDRRAQLNT